MKAIFVLMDSLNRNYLSIYGNTWVKTPNIERFAKRSLIFTNHWLGSAPCMPARRDMLTGRLNFLERGWGGFEPYDIPFPTLLRKAGIFTHMETDHYHYFHVGGENYNTCFNTWAFHRGQEHDGYISKVKSIKAPKHLGQWCELYTKNKSLFKTDANYPTPRTFQGAVEWLKNNKDADDYFLWVEAFDPHEPFDTPDEFVDLYNDTWKGEHYDWSGYEEVNEHSEATKHLRKKYAATLTMADKWFGKLLDEIERQNGFEDTLIIFTTDHGHMLGEHGLAGKSKWYAWNQMAHIPLIVHLPKSKYAGEKRNQLSQNIDIMPTILEYFSVKFNNPINGYSLMSILKDNVESKRKTALYGWFGQTVNITDGKYTYFRAAAKKENKPLYQYFLTPTKISHHDLPSKEFFKKCELGKFLPYTDFPVLRSEVENKRSLDQEYSILFDIKNDYEQLNPISDRKIEKKYIELLVKHMKQVDAPREQFKRLGLL